MSQGAGISFSVRGRLGSEAPKKRDADEPFRLLLVGDFSGRGARRVPRPELRRPRRVDVAELEQVFAAFGAELEVPGPGGQAESLRPRSLDDLHPDALLSSLTGFEEGKSLLDALAERVVSPDTLSRARRYLGESQGVAVASQAAAAPADGNDSSTLARLLGRAPSAAAEAEAPRPSPLSSLLEEAVRPHKSEPSGGERDSLRAALEQVLQARLRGVLQAPALRALEATWRGADRVIRALDTDEALEIYLFDVCLEELKQTFSGATDPEHSELHRLLVANSPGFSVVAADIAFDAEDSALQALAGLSALSARAGGALLADAAPGLLGCASGSELSDPKQWSARPLPPLWHALRTSPLSRRIGLVFPRVLARARYGQKADPIESFAFEELSSNELATNERLWSSGAFAVAELLGLAFREHGWGYLGSLGLSLSDLPSDTFLQDGERLLVPASEFFLNQRAAEALLAQGVMPLMARRDRSSVGLLQLASISEPRAALLGVDSDA